MKSNVYDDGQGHYMCSRCQTPIIGVEYEYSHPEAYDGISEWQCPNCKLRTGRWTGNTLKDGESEPKYGLKREA